MSNESDLIEYKCPKCGGALEFNSGEQKMKCPFCDSVFEVDEVRKATEPSQEKPEESKKSETENDNEWRADELQGKSVFVCESCGGEIIGDDSLTSTKCPFCGNSIVIKSGFAGGYKPDGIIPFKLDKAAAKEALKEHTKGKKFVPGIFRNNNHLDEIKGVYVPFWVYTLKVHADFEFEAQKSTSNTNNDIVTTTTRYYTPVRQGDIVFTNVPVDASKQMPDDLMDSIEPFDIFDEKDFQMPYLAGYLAQKYDIDSDECFQRADKRIRATVEQEFTNSVSGYDSTTVTNSQVDVIDKTVKYVLLPVWILSTSWNNQNFIFAMNGQTGKFIGDLPVDNKAYWLRFSWIAGLIGAAAFGIAKLLGIA